MLAMTPAAQFTWLHRFYLVLDRVAQQHKVRAAGKVCSLGCRWNRPHRKVKLPFCWPHLNHLNLSPSCFQVYKLYGGSHGFMLSTGVAEADPNHATTLLRCALHLLQVFEPVSGMAHRDLCVPACRHTAGPPHSPPPPPPPLFVLPQIRMSDGQSADVVMALASGPATSGLLGSHRCAS